MNINSIFPIIFLCFLLIAADWAVFALRKKNSRNEKKLSFSLHAIASQIRLWLGGNIPLQSGLNSQSGTDSTLPASLQLNGPAALENKSANQDQAQIPQTDPDAPIENIIRFRISADIPENSTVRLTLDVTNEHGKSSIQKELHSGEELLQASISPAPGAASKIELLPYSGEPNPLNSKTERKISLWGKIISQAVGWNLNIQNLDRILLLAAIAIYAFVVSLGIDRYPIYFFTDEAIHMNLASDFLRDGLKNYYGEFLPTFFSIEGWVNGTSVYLQVLPLIVFGKSVLVTRLVSALVSLLGALAVGLLLKDSLKLKYYWTGIFLVLTTPAWFLHARTAFEYVEVASFYSIFLYFYSRYRAGHLKSFYWAIIAGALTFYTHGLGQILMGVTGLALFIVDFRYHAHPDRRKTVMYGLLLGVILLLPFVRYYLAHPGEAAAQIKRRGSYWTNPNFTLPQKITNFFRQFIQGLNPAYWFFPNSIDLNRHIMYRYGNGTWYTLPLVVIGLGKALRNFRLPTYRLILVALLAVPIPASVVAIGMPRMLWMTIPLALLATIGLVVLLEWVESRWRFPAAWIASGIFILLAGSSLFMLRDALVNGPTWFTDYRLYGMQYGAKQIFQDVVRAGLAKDPKRIYVVSPSWANGTEQFVAFFIPPADQARVSMGQPVDFIAALKKNPTDMYFVTTSEEYDRLITNPEFKNINIDQVLPLPDGKPGFYILTLNVSDNIDQIIAAEQEVERKPMEDIIIYKGESMRVVHSPLGSGRIEDVFDNNPDTLARVKLANPFTFDLYPANPISTQSVDIQTGALPDFSVTVSLYAPGVATPVTYTQTYKGFPPDPLVTLNFDKGPAKAERIYIEIKDNTSGDRSQIHVRTIQFK